MVDISNEYIQGLQDRVKDFNYEKEQEKYADRLSEFNPPQRNYDVFDLATSLSQGLSAQKQTDQPNSIGGGFALGFNQASQEMKQRDAEYVKARREIGLQAARMAMEDEQEATKLLDEGEKAIAEGYLKQQGGSTALIDNINHIGALYAARDQVTEGSKEYERLTIQIRNGEAGIGAYKYDAGRLAELKAAEMAAAQGRIGLTVLTESTLKSDAAFGVWRVNEWILKGGGVNEQTYLESLSSVRDILIESDKSGEDITSVGLGILAKYPTASTFFNEKGVVLQDRIAAVAQLSLKAILGGQFSEREGELLIQRAFNPSLPASENIARVTQLINRIQSAETFKKAAVTHWEKPENKKSLDTFVTPKYAEGAFRSDLESYYRQDMGLFSDEALMEEFVKPELPDDSIYYKILKEEINKRNQK